MYKNHFCRNSEWSGFSVKTSKKGWIVEIWSLIQHTETGRKVLIPYSYGKDNGYDKNTDLHEKHNYHMCVGDWVYHLYNDWVNHDLYKVLKKGHIVN